MLQPLGTIKPLRQNGRHGIRIWKDLELLKASLLSRRRWDTLLPNMRLTKSSVTCLSKCYPEQEQLPHQ